MTHQTFEHHFDTAVVGGGQAGLAMGYFLAQQERDFLILDAGDRVGDTWRNRWDSLRLFTPAFHSGLPGMPFPAPGRSFPTKSLFGKVHTSLAIRLSIRRIIANSMNVSLVCTFRS